MATWRGFSWKKVPGMRLIVGLLFPRVYMVYQAFILAQVMGGLVGSAIVYGNYSHAINIFESGHRTQATAGLFATYAVRRFWLLHQYLPLTPAG